MKHHNLVPSLQQITLNDAVPCDYCGCFVVAQKIMNFLDKKYCRICFDHLAPKLYRQLLPEDNKNPIPPEKIENTGINSSFTSI